MVVPMILKGEGIKRNVTIDTATSEDLGATIFHLMGIQSDDVEGEILTEMLETSDSEGPDVIPVTNIPDPSNTPNEETFQRVPL